MTGIHTELQGIRAWHAAERIRIDNRALRQTAALLVCIVCFAIWVVA